MGIKKRPERRVPFRRPCGNGIQKKVTSHPTQRNVLPELHDPISLYLYCTINIMDRIILEVDDQVAKNWRYSSEKKRREVSGAINKMLELAFKQKGDDDFIQFVKVVQEKAAERGLTEEILNEILNDPN